MKSIKLKSVITLLLMLSMMSAVFFGCSNAQNVKDEKDLSTSEEQSSTEPIEKTETIFKSGRDFSDGVAWVNTGDGGLNTLIDSNGKVLFTLTDDSAMTDFVNGVALTYNRLIDKNNNTLFDLNDSTEDVKYHFLNHSDDVFYGYTFVKVDTNTYDSVSTKVGVLDNKGNWYREPCEELCSLIINYGYNSDYVRTPGFGLYYESGNSFNAPTIYNIYTNELSHDEKMFDKWKNDYLLKYSENLAFNGEQISTGYSNDTFINAYFNNANGEHAIDLSKYRIFTYDNFVPTFNEEYCALELFGADSAMHYVTIIDKKGNEQFSPLKIGQTNSTSVNIGKISNGLLAVSTIGYINLKGEIIIPRENLDSCKSLGDFSEEGIAKIQKLFDDGVYYIDTTGEIAF